MHHLLCFPTRRSSDLERQLHRVDTPALRELLRRFAAEEGDPVDRLGQGEAGAGDDRGMRPGVVEERVDRQSTRLNSSHTVISYAVFCLKNKKSIYQIL